MIIKNLFPNGKTRAFTTSYDDAICQDKKLVSLFNKHGIRGTFNLNSGLLSGDIGWESEGVEIRHVDKSEVKELYAGHEVAVHTVTHPNLVVLPREIALGEIIEDRKSLEELVGYPVRGGAYPYGTYNKEIVNMLKTAGIEYFRTVVSSHRFNLPSNPIELEATCHHDDDKVFSLIDEFLETKQYDDLKLFYLWGHSYEFDTHNNWDRIEKICDLVANHGDVWYATNIEIIDYLNAVNGLKCSVTGSSIYNPSALSVWVTVNDKPTEIKSGETLRF